MRLNLHLNWKFLKYFLKKMFRFPLLLDGGVRGLIYLFPSFTEHEISRRILFLVALLPSKSIFDAFKAKKYMRTLKSVFYYTLHHCRIFQI